MRVRTAMAKLAQGKEVQEIAEEMGIHRNTVGKLLAADEAKAILDKADDDITRMIGKIVNRAEDIIDAGEDTDAIKLMLAFMKTKGLVKDAVEHHHKFPKPRVIKYKDEKIVLGVVEEAEDDDDSER